MQVPLFEGLLNDPFFVGFCPAEVAVGGS